MKPIIHFAPLQSFTDRVYRTTLNQNFGDVDHFYTPYLNVENDGFISSKKAKDLDDGAEDYDLIPQILPGNIDELKILIGLIERRGFSTLNLNLGCPWPMVQSKGRGAALIHKPEIVAEFVAYIHQETELELSIKTRLGIEENHEVQNLIDALGGYLDDKIFIHARNANQMYKGQPDMEAFKDICGEFPDRKLIYNGDIFRYQDFLSLKQLTSEVKEVMIGRGLLQNPFLAWQIKTGNATFPDGYASQMICFLNELIQNVVKDSSDDGHALNRLKVHAVYFTSIAEEGKSWYRKLKKTKSLSEFENQLKTEFIE